MSSSKEPKQHDERREELRNELQSLLPGEFSLMATNEILKCLPVDISKNGLGVIIETEIEANSLLQFKSTNHTLVFKVMWCQPDFTNNNSFRYGLLCQDSEKDLRSIFKL